MMSTQSETREFQAETRQLLDLMVHSVYSDKDSFLRELISNASDALDKLRLESLVDKDLDVDTSDLHITLEPSSNDSAERTLTIRDNGIGMSRDEVVELIGTLARSGTAELRAKLAQASDSAATEELIGQFGIGFYSTFMVADKVTLVTRKAGEQTGTRWESTGDGTYTITDVDDAPQGTSVTLTLKPPTPRTTSTTTPTRRSFAHSSSVTPISSRGRSGWTSRRRPPLPRRTTATNRSPRPPRKPKPSIR